MNSKEVDLNGNENGTIDDDGENISKSSASEMPDKKIFCPNMRTVVSDYCAKTSIHGIQYLGETRPFREKLFWFSVFVISIYCALTLIRNIYIKWNETPVIVSFSEKSTPVWNIPFPAVTICTETKRTLRLDAPSYGDLFNMLKVDVKNKRRFTAKMANLSDTELEEFVTLLHICNTQIIDEGIPVLYPQHVDYFAVLDRMAPSFDAMFTFCKWFNVFGDCKGLFIETYTEEGVCFTFNGLNNTDLYRENTCQHQKAQEIIIPKSNWLSNRSLSWSLENGYSKNTGIHTYPARVLSAGSRAGLFVAIQNLGKNLDYLCRGPIQGFKVLLHSPDDVPQVSKQFVRIPLGKEILIAVKPNMITTSGGIAYYHPQRRQCFLSNERELKFFKIYTQTNCELECLTNFTLNKCGCVKFSMPRTHDMPICREDKIHCYAQAEDDLLLREFTEGLKTTDFNYRGLTECNCMPACTSLVYNAEISQGNFDLDKLLSAMGITNTPQDLQMSRLEIYFKENQFITSKRSELYGITDFLANCGGIFGLFMGFSILSLVEMLYHFTLRFWSNVQC
uniref:Uncharacterized protein n=1 Tax=Glossina palpalis gambiensis TaxID=67801 RepID=A0A1B0AX56_9MUSC